MQQTIATIQADIATLKTNLSALEGAVTSDKASIAELNTTISDLQANGLDSESVAALTEIHNSLAESNAAISAVISPAA